MTVIYFLKFLSKLLYQFSAAAVAVVPGVVAGVKKYGKQIVQGFAKLVLKR